MNKLPVFLLTGETAVLQDFALGALLQSDFPILVPLEDEAVGTHVQLSQTGHISSRSVNSGSRIQIKGVRSSRCLFRNVYRGAVNMYRAFFLWILLVKTGFVLSLEDLPALVRVPNLYFGSIQFSIQYSWGT